MARRRALTFLQVVNYFAGLWNLPVEEAWGYVTCSGTEGNMHAMIVARECLPGAPVYFSTQTHYSIAKSAGFYRMEACPVDTRDTGEICMDDFRKKLQANKDRGIYTAIVNVNCGTTVRGGIDNLDEVVKASSEGPFIRSCFGSDSCPGAGRDYRGPRALLYSRGRSAVCSDSAASGRGAGQGANPRLYAPHFQPVGERTQNDGMSHAQRSGGAPAPEHQGKRDRREKR